MVSVPRLRRADCSGPGIFRRRRGKAFEYLTGDGRRIVEPSVLERIRELAIPPAWSEVWICPYPNGHIQATGVDAAGRKQYRYHDLWRQRRDREKFEAMLLFARALPGLRARVEQDMALEGMPRERALACAARLLDRGFFRIGSESYAEENDTYGVATMQKRHVTIENQLLTFDYEAKGSKKRVQAIADPQLAEVVGLLKRRRGGSPELLAFRVGRRWVDVKSSDINAYVKEVTGGSFSAKDFRTWSGTVIAAIVLANDAAAGGPAASRSASARKRTKNAAVKAAAHMLGNTPAVARASYVDPRVFDRYDGGRTIGGVLPELHGDGVTWPDVQPTIEQAVLDLLEGDWSSEAIQKVA
jgi:DNA topoisomerase IB